mgnify:CR=1 FL=1
MKTIIKEVDKVKRKIFLLITMLLFMVNTAYAGDLTWSTVPGNHNQSNLLVPGSVSSKDISPGDSRGEYLSTGVLEIVNQSNGSIYICVDTLAHVNVDRIRHTVFLDQWDEKNENWIQVDSWNFERTKEEEGGELSMMTDTITIKNVATNRYYRARGLHMVEIGDEIEGCATETDGVLITKD